MNSLPRLMHVIRLDSMPVTKATFTEEGYLVDRPVVTSVGIFEYRNPDGTTRRELRLPEEVFDKESLESYRGKPVVLTHDAGLVSNDNVHDYQIGTIMSNGYRSGADVRAEIVIHDTKKMKESGLKELSLGYNLDLDETPGFWKGQPYDAVQRNIRINHLALVREARAGDQARLNIDSRDGNTLRGGKATMRKVKKTRRTDSVLSPEELQKAIEQYKARKEAETATDAADDEPVEEAAPSIVPAPKPAPKPAAPKSAPAPKPEDDVADQMADIKDRNTDADDDMKLLFDIIDTLLADKAFDAAMEEQAGNTDGKNCTKADCGTNNDCGGKMDADDDDIPDFAAGGDDDDAAAEDEPVAEDGEDDDPDSIPMDDEDEEDDDVAMDDASSISYSNDDPVPVANRKPDVINTDSIDAIVRQRVCIARIGDKLNLDGLDNMKLQDAKKAIIKAVTPSLRLDGKSDAYIEALFDRAVSETDARTRKDVTFQMKQMFNKDSRSARLDTDSAEARRLKMINRRLGKKEDK